MPVFEAPYFWQDSVADSLRRAHQQDRLPHALLIHGAQGLGKLDLARTFAKFLLCACKDKPTCQSCSLYAAGNHPDYLCIQPEASAKSIKVDQIRLLNTFVQQSAHISSRRVVIIEPCDSLNLAGANALLKSLEEPAANTVFILISSNTDLLPATLLSRCQRFYIAHLDAEQPSAPLKQFFGGKDYASALQLSCGAPLLAKQILEDGRIQQFEQFANHLRALLSQQSDPLSTYLACEKMNFVDLLRWQIVLLQDILYHHFELSRETACDNGFLAILYSQSRRVDARKCYYLMDKLTQSLQKAHLSLNKQMALESLFFAWPSIIAK